MTARRSAGLLLFRRTPDGVEVLIGHMGGPYWHRRDAGAWSIPKGEYDPDEDPLRAARREFLEETGHRVPGGRTIPLGEVRQPSGKVVACWAVEGDLDAETAHSNTFSLEWPHGSGRVQDFPELDRLDWVDARSAQTLLLSGQVPFLDRLAEVLADPGC